MNQTTVLVVLGAVVAAFILWPLLRRTRTSPGATVPPASRPVLVPPDELAELEMDRAMGRISDADYQRMKARYEAVVAMPTPVPSAPVAAALRAEAMVRKWREAPRTACPTCGVRPEPEARFCSNCGAMLGGSA